MKPTDRLTYELYKLRNRRDLEALISRQHWLGAVYLLAGVAVAMALAWSFLNGACL